MALLVLGDEGLTGAFMPVWTYEENLCVGWENIFPGFCLHH